jgi:hypothetical protein
MSARRVVSRPQTATRCPPCANALVSAQPRPREPPVMKTTSESAAGWSVLSRASLDGRLVRLRVQRRGSCATLLLTQVPQAERVRFSTRAERCTGRRCARSDSTVVRSENDRPLAALKGEIRKHSLGVRVALPVNRDNRQWRCPQAPCSGIMPDLPERSSTASSLQCIPKDLRKRSFVTATRFERA